MWNIFISQLNVDAPLNPCMEWAGFDRLSLYDMHCTIYRGDTHHPSDSTILFHLNKLLFLIVIHLFGIFTLFIFMPLLLFYFYFFKPYMRWCGILVPLPGIEPVFPALGVDSESVDCQGSPSLKLPSTFLSVSFSSSKHSKYFSSSRNHNCLHVSISYF